MAEQPPTTYGHRLKRDPFEIRLLTLHAGEPGSPLQCTLSTAVLAHCPPFAALSYVWGDSRITETVSVDGHIISATANLVSALQNLRGTREPLVLWIDALCINQADVEERNAQVQMMGDIYTTASRVLAWIGDADEQSDAAFDSMAIIATGIVDEQARKRTCSFYLSVGDRKWFQRCWILQELALAREDPTVVCGSKQIPWSVFMRAWRVLAIEVFAELGMARYKSEEKDEFGEIPYSEMITQLKIDVLDNLRREVSKKGGMSLRDLFMISRSSEATEPRDRIYALLGMLSKADRECYPAVDYTQPVTTVYAQAMAHLFTKGQGPFFLSGLWLPGPSITGHPSWMIDFSAQTSEKAIGYPGWKFRPASPHSASGPGAGAENGVVLDDHLTLKVEALPVDYVEAVIRLSANFDDCLQSLADLEKHSALARRKHIDDDLLRPLLESFRSSEPLWRILISDKKVESGYDEAPSVYGEMFEDLLHAIRDPLLYEDSSPELVDTEYTQALRQNLPGRTFFTTRNGFVGLGDAAIQPEDEITIWFGAPTTFAVRKHSEKENCHQLVGAAYVGGIMKGEMVDQLYCEDLLDSRTLFVV